jgi:hypothetical protein
MNILIIDDDGDKIKNVVSAIAETNLDISVDIREDVISSKQLLTTLQYHLLIVDLQLPIRKGQYPIPDGGKNLISELYRSDKCILPYLIIGLTQFREIKHHFPILWKTVLYNESDWKVHLHMAIKHIDRVINQPSILKRSNLPTIYVEGETDYNLLTLAFNLYRPEALMEINIEFQKSGGASWVKNQVVAWAYSLNKDINEEYLRAVALLDNDEAGKDAINEIRRLVPDDSAPSKTFKILKYSPKYNNTLRKLYTQGIHLPVTLEEVLGPKVWELADSNGLLRRRMDLDGFLTTKSKWDKMNQSLSEYLQSLNLDTIETLYLNEFTMKGKVKIYKILKKQDRLTQINLLSNFESLLDDLIDNLKI